MQWDAGAAARAALAALVLAAASPVLADTVSLRNGDRLTGTIRHLSADALTLQTPYAGEVRISRSDIANFETDGDVEYLPYWGATPHRASFSPAQSPGVVTIENGEGAREIPLSRVAVLKPRPEETENGVAITGQVTLSGAWASGNSDSERASGEADLGARARDWRGKLGLKLRHEREGGQTNADYWLVGGNYDRFMDESRFRYVRASLEHDRFKDLSLRSTVGGGLGVQLVDSDRTQLSLRGGLDFVTEDRLAAADEGYPAAGWGVTFKHRLKFASAEVFHDQEGYSNLHDTGQMTLRSRSGLRVPISAGLTASLQLNVDWEREPSPGRRPADSAWSLGVGYRW
ncbi:MAG: YdiY family protein [Gammaproteobacteria bacterium]